MCETQKAQTVKGSQVHGGELGREPEGPTFLLGVLAAGWTRDPALSPRLWRNETTLDKAANPWTRATPAVNHALGGLCPS